MPRYSIIILLKSLAILRDLKPALTAANGSTQETNAKFIISLVAIWPRRGGAYPKKREENAARVRENQEEDRGLREHRQWHRENCCPRSPCEEARYLDPLIRSGDRRRKSLYETPRSVKT